MQRAVRVALLGAGLGLAAAGGYALLQSHARAASRSVVEPAQASPGVPSAPTSAAPAAAAAQTVKDPLSPDRPATVDATRAIAGNWVRARPGFQYSRSAAERGGVEPCATRAVDAGTSEDWIRLSQGHFVAPRDFALDASGRFDLMIHLYGDEPVRREWLESGAHFVLYTLTFDPSQSYAPLFSGSSGFEAIVSEIERAVSERTGSAARRGHIGLSAWSAGFAGVEGALAGPVAKSIDAVILIDGLHAPRGDDEMFKAQLKPFVDYAARAAEGERFMVVSHSSIDPPHFASTSECAHYLIASLGGKPEPVRRADALGLELVEYFSRGDFHVRGYAGNDTADHCAQLAVLRDAYAALARRWAASPN